jgi:hypothetical protein
MRFFLGVIALSLSVFCSGSFAFDLFAKGNQSGPASTTSSTAPATAAGSQNSTVAKGRVGPVIGGMLDDGREVPVRFRDKKTRAQQNSEKKSAQKDDEDSANN